MARPSACPAVSSLARAGSGRPQSKGAGRSAERERFRPDSVAEWVASVQAVAEPGHDSFRALISPFVTFRQLH